MRILGIDMLSTVLISPMCPQDGRFELGPTIAAGGAAMDEIVISGIAMAEYKRREHGDDSDDAFGAGIQLSTAVLGGGGT